MPSPRPIIRAPRLRGRIKQLGRALTRDLAGAPALVVPLLDGSFCFVADLVRCIPLIDLRLHFARAASYHGGTESSGSVALEDVPDCTGLQVLLVDDILDSGRTLQAARDHLCACGASRVITCVLLDKPSRRVVAIEADHVGFTIGDDFVVGYGLDHADRYRHLPDVCVLDGLEAR